MEKIIGAQLYTIRDYCKDVESFDKAMAKVKEIGYKHVQISGVGVEDPYEIKRICDKYGLTISCTHRSYKNFMENLDGEIERHKILGTDCAGVGSIAMEQRDSVEALMETIENLNRFTEEFAKHGMTFTYHNHAFEFIKLDGKYIYDYMIEHGKFSFIFDTYWAAYAGIDPAKIIRKLGKRAICVHYKDLMIKNRSDIVIAEVGQGNLDWDEIIKACDDADVKWALVEQDTCETDSIGCLETSYNFLKTKGFN